MGPLSISDSPLVHFGLSAASVLGLGALGSLEWMVRKDPEGEEEDEDGVGEAEGEALNLSSVVGSRQNDPLSWVVVPPRALFLKPAVVS